MPLYLDYAATTPTSQEVLAEMLPFFTENFGNAHSRHHAFGWIAEEAIAQAQLRIAEKLKCKPKEILFTSGSTESINLALRGTALSQIISFKTEHKATLDTCQYLAKQGKKVQILEVDSNGLPDLEEVIFYAKNEPSLISALWVNNETGVVFPIEKLLEIKDKYQGVIHVDATQAIGKIAVDFNASNIDLLSLSAHKIFGPKGVGALLVSPNIKLEAQLLGGGHQRGLRSGTLNVPGIVGLGKAIVFANVFEHENLATLHQYFEGEILRTISNCSINGSSSPRVNSISNICFNGRDGEDLLQRLSKIAISNGSACNSASTLPSHVLKAMGCTDDEAFASLRFSFSPYTTKNDVDFCISHIQEVLNQVEN